MRLLSLILVMSFVSVAQAGSQEDYMKFTESCQKTHPTSALQVIVLYTKMMKYESEVSLIEGLRRRSNEGRRAEFQILEFLANKSAELKSKGKSECDAALSAIQELMKDTIVRAKAVAQLPSRKNFKTLLFSDAELNKRMEALEAEEKKREEEQAKLDAEEANKTEEAKADETKQDDSAEAEQFSVDLCSDKNKDIESKENKLKMIVATSADSLIQVRFGKEKLAVKDCAEYSKLLSIYGQTALVIDKEAAPIATASFGGRK